MILAYVWAIVAAFAVPVLIILVGMLAKVLESGDIQGEYVRLGTYLAVPIPNFFPEQPEFQLAALVAVTFAVAALFCFAIWRHRVAADRAQ